VIEKINIGDAGNISLRAALVACDLTPTPLLKERGFGLSPLLAGDYLLFSLSFRRGSG
jgi:hypothetical protein